MITDTDITYHVNTYLDAAGEAGEGFDREAIVGDLIAAYDLTGDAPAMTFDDIPEDELADVLQKHDGA